MATDKILGPGLGALFSNEALAEMELYERTKRGLDVAENTVCQLNGFV
jgi:hypothetical protein